VSKPAVYTIRQLTKALGISARALRYYEDEGLVSPKRVGQARLYDEADRARVLVILRGRRLGFTLGEMRDMLRNYDFKDSQVREQMLMARTKFLERLERLQTKRRDIEESVRHICECLADVDAALEGKPIRPWYAFFRDIMLTQRPTPTHRTDN
jgi:DNA-binding transcriptional MerR regulator